MSQAKKHAGIFWRGEHVYIQPNFEDTTGILIGGEPVEVLERSAAEPELGRALLTALANSRSGVPHPVDWNSVPDYLLAAAGVRNLRTFMKGARSCHVSADAHRIKLTPTRNGGSRLGFQFQGDLSHEVPLTAPVGEIGQAILRALDRSS